jgi:hypothetical protein
MSIGALAAGITPPQVLPESVRATGTLTTVEASDVAVVSGSARITVRFTAEPETVASIAAHTVSATREVAQVISWRVTRREGSRWMPVV